MAHTGQVAAETIATDNNGSYTTVSPATLNAIDKSILTAAGSAAEAVCERRERNREQLDGDDHVADRQHVHDRQELHRRPELHLHRPCR